MIREVGAATALLQPEVKKEFCSVLTSKNTEPENHGHSLGECIIKVCVLTKFLPSTPEPSPASRFPSVAAEEENKLTIRGQNGSGVHGQRGSTPRCCILTVIFKGSPFTKTFSGLA